jgi:hypothetical protein
VAASGSPAVRGGGGTALERYWNVMNPFWGSGEEWLTGVALTMVAWLAEGGSPVRGRWRGQGQSLCGHRGAPGRGDACGGGDEAELGWRRAVGMKALSRRRRQRARRGVA